MDQYEQNECKVMLTFILAEHKPAKLKQLNVIELRWASQNKEKEVSKSFSRNLWVTLQRVCPLIVQSMVRLQLMHKSESTAFKSESNHESLK